MRPESLNTEWLVLRAPVGRHERFVVHSDVDDPPPRFIDAQCRS